MQEEIEIKYRKYFLASAPRPTKLKIPGWAGTDKKHCDGASAQPWHCLPFVEGATYGYEYLYPFESECHVKKINGKLCFEGDFSQEPWTMGEDGSPISPTNPKKSTPPMMAFAQNHYGMTSLIDLEPPEGYVIRTEPHPRFYTDTTGNCPIMIVGHLQRWWSHVFFVVFKSPKEGEVHIFKKGDPCGQFIFVKNNLKCNFIEMNYEEKRKREVRQQELSCPDIAKKKWKSDSGYSFNDKYKVLSSAYLKEGDEGIEDIIKRSQ